MKKIIQNSSDFEIICYNNKLYHYPNFNNIKIFLDISHLSIVIFYCYKNYLYLQQDILCKSRKFQQDNDKTQGELK